MVLVYTVRMDRNDILKLVISSGATELAGLVGSVFTAPSVSLWYASLQKPYFAPPNWLFSPVWTVLFVLLGLSLFLIWRHGWRHREVKQAIILYIVQLSLTITWSIIFFGLESPGWAALLVVFLWFSVFGSIASGLRVSKAAAYLLIPHVLWLAYAVYFNIALLLLPV